MRAGKRSQKDNLELLKDRFTAVYFNGQKRILTYGYIDRMEAVLELQKIQEREKVPISMLLVKDDLIEAGQTSWHLTDYLKYLKVVE